MTKKGKRNAEKRCCVTSAPSRARHGPHLHPPPEVHPVARATGTPFCGGGHRRGPLASRRSTTALAVATQRHRSARATRLPGTCSERPPRWFERRSASQLMTRNRQPVSMRHSRALPAPCCPSPARLHPQTGHDADRACLAQAAREPK
jgi:hypothetical protein